MLKSKKSKLLALAMTLALAGSLFAGCGNQNSANSSQTITYNINAEPKTIDPGLSNSIEGGQVIVNAFEGLLDLDKNGQPVPGVAEKWDVSKDGLHYVFHLRKDAKWSDGKPVTAHDFEYAWKRALDPKTASQYAYQLYYLKNGEAYNNSADPKATNKATADQVGVKAVDDYTLDVTLESPTPYFLSLMSFPTYMPVRKDIVEKHPNSWATKASTYISDGPFMLKDWKLKDSLVLVKNPNYWDAKNIKLNTLVLKTLDQATSYYAAFKTGQIDIIDYPPRQETPQLIKNGTAKVYPYLGTYYYDLNISGNLNSSNPAVAKALNDVRVRKALTLAIDRTKLTKDITKGGEIPATGFVPNGIKETATTDFKQKDYFPAAGDVAQAKKLLADAGYPDGKGFPKMTIIYNTDQAHQDIAQAIQDMWKKNLGIQVDLRNVERKVQLTMMSNHNFQIVRDGWIADYADPMTFLDMFTSNSGNNYSGYSNPAYDKLIASAKAEPDAAKRMALMHQAEDMLMNDMPIIPLYYYTLVSCQKSYVKDVVRSPLGFDYFRTSYIQK
jgi:oligopeptide transport system substrate-binding protein